MDKYDIFISYSRKDLKVVEPFVQRLESAGYKVWIDKYGVYTGTQFKSVIVEAIENSTVFIFFSSQNSNVSPWTTQEIGIAVNRKKHIIPIKLDESNYNRSVEFDLINLDFVDYYSKSNREYEIGKLTRTLENILGIPESGETVDSRDDEKPEENVNSGETSHDQSSIISSLKKNRGCVISITVLSLLLTIGLPIIYYSTQSHNPPITSASNPSASPSVVSTEPQVIDLGLPSGTVWCDRNVGANNPYEKGKLYPWSEDIDFASQIMGSNWSTPTKLQLEELINNCNWKMTTLNGTYGIQGTSKKNGKTIFLPAAGRTTKDNSIEQSNTIGFYWSCDKNIQKNNIAYNLKFYDKRIYVDDGYTNMHRSIRPVENSKLISASE